MKLLPDSLFVGEETFFHSPKIIENYHKKNFCWTVDPIDGTTNFVKGKEKFAVMIALTFKEKIIQSFSFLLKTIPTLRIDYIFHPVSFSTVQYKRGGAGISDHFFILADIQFPPNEAF